MRILFDGIKVECSCCLDCILSHTGFCILSPDSLECLDLLFLRYFSDTFPFKVVFHSIFHSLLDDGSTCNHASTLLCLYCLSKPLVSLDLYTMSTQLLNGSAHNLFNLSIVPLSFFKLSGTDPDSVIRWKMFSCLVEHDPRILVRL